MEESNALLEETIIIVEKEIKMWQRCIDSGRDRHMADGGYVNTDEVKEKLSDAKKRLKTLNCFLNDAAPNKGRDNWIDMIIQLNKYYEEYGKICDA